MSVSHFTNNESIRRVVVSGKISEESAAQFLEIMTLLEHSDPSKLITIYVDTYGGSVDSGMLMYDTMSICQSPIRTIGIGKVMSAGSLILASGDPGNRFVTKNTRVMIHQISGGMRGTMSDMDIEMKEMARLHDQYAAIMSKHTGKTKKQILEDLSINNYMTAAEAVKYGLADKVMSAVTPAKKARKKSK